MWFVAIADAVTEVTDRHGADVCDVTVNIGV